MPAQLTISTSVQIALDLMVWCASDGGLLAASLVFGTRMSRHSVRGALGLVLSLVVWIGAKAAIVQTLGLLGALTPMWLIVASVATAVALAATSRGGRDARSAWRRVAVVTRSALAGPRGGAGWVAAAALAVLVLRAGLVEGLDSLSIQGPMIVEWLQHGRVSLLSYWNYPQVWEYQAVPALLLGPGDILAVVPRLTGAVLLLLTTTEVGRRLGLSARASWTAGWFAVLSPLVWGLEHGEGTFKNDVAMAVGVLLGILAIERAVRRVGGCGALFSASAFLMVGTKPTGFLFTSIVVAILAAVGLVRRRRPPLLRAGLLAGSLMMVPGATQLANLVEHGNPIFPFSMKIGSVEILAGTLDVTGTSILEHAWDARTWEVLLRGTRDRAGRETPTVIGAGVVGLAIAIIGLDRRRTPRAPRRCTALVFAGSVTVLTIAWLGTPWSRGVSDADVQFLSSGLTLRYALAPVVVLMTAGFATTYRILPWLVSSTLGPLIWLGFAIARWGGRWALWLSAPETLWWLFACLATGFLAALWILRERSRRAAASATLAAALISLTLVWPMSLERRRESEWVPGARAIWRTIWYGQPRPPMTIGISDPRVTRRYLLFGPRLGNRLRVVSPSDLAGISPDELRFYLLQERPRSAQRLPERLELLSRSGWHQKAESSDGRSILLEHAEPRRQGPTQARGDAHHCGGSPASKEGPSVAPDRDSSS